jgi:uncharacterized membrane protein
MKNSQRQRTETTPRSVQANLDTVAKLEEEFLEQRTLSDRIADAMAGFTGSIVFVIWHALWFLGWVVINTGYVPGIPPFDPFPFVFLNMIVSLEAVLLSTFVLMKQNRMSWRADHRAHLNLQIDLLAEKENTKVLQLLQQVCHHLGLEEPTIDKEIKELSQQTAVEKLARELKERLPGE